MSPDETLSLAASLLAHGQSLETQSPPALAEAVRAYDEVIARLRTLPLGDERIRRDLAVGLMNRGNALQRQNSPAAIADALCGYDEAIAFFRSLPLGENPDYRNALGAVWMSRGHALRRRPDSASLTEAIRSQGEAIALLRTLPLDANRSFPINLAAAWMNQSHALLVCGEPVPALASAREAISVAASAEATDPALADIGLKARCAWCEAAGQLLGAPDAYAPSREPLADEASDVVDDALAHARDWESRGFPVFRPITVSLFRFGAQLYAVHLPDFLGEFLLEHIDPARSEDAMPDTEEFYVIASGAVAAVRRELENRRTVFLDTPETAQLLERLRGLRATEARLTELHALHLGGRVQGASAPLSRSVT